MMEETGNHKILNYQILFDGVSATKGLVALSVRSEINRIPKATLEYNFHQFVQENCKEENYTLSPASGFENEVTKSLNFEPGSEVEIRLGWDKENQKVFEGLITKHHLSVRNNGEKILTLDCKHKANLMTLTSATRILHQDAGSDDSGETVSKVNDDQALSYLVENSGTGLSLDIQDEAPFVFGHENLIQYECSDWDFLVLRAEATARVCYTEGDRIQLLKPAIGEPIDFKIDPATNLLSYEAELDETVIKPEFTINNWSVDEQDLAQNSQTAKVAEGHSPLISADAMINYPGDIPVNESVTFIEAKLARNEMARTMSTSKVIGTTEVRPGDTIELKFLMKSWKRQSFVSGVRHEVVNGSWYTFIQCGLTAKSHAEIFNITCKDAMQLMAPAGGLHYGKVAGYRKAEDGHELIEVEMPAGNAGGESQLIYARLATLTAGSNGGTVFRPFPGDEVIIGFVGNDPRFPVILGSLFNNRNETPFSIKNGEQTQTGLAIKDWQILIDDEKNKLSISSPGGQKVTLDDENKEITMMHDNQNKVLINSEGITLEGNTVKINGQKGIELNGSGIRGKADTEITLESGLNLNLEGKVMAKLKGQVTQIN